MYLSALPKSIAKPSAELWLGAIAIQNLVRNPPSFARNLSAPYNTEAAWTEIVKAIPTLAGIDKETLKGILNRVRPTNTKRYVFGSFETPYAIGGSPAGVPEGALWTARFEIEGGADGLLGGRRGIVNGGVTVYQPWEDFSRSIGWYDIWAQYQRDGKFPVMNSANLLNPKLVYWDEEYGLWTTQSNLKGFYAGLGLIELIAFAAVLGAGFAAIGAVGAGAGAGAGTTAAGTTATTATTGGATIAGSTFTAAEVAEMASWVQSGMFPSMEAAASAITSIPTLTATAPIVAGTQIAAPIIVTAAPLAAPIAIAPIAAGVAAGVGTAALVGAGTAPAATAPAVQTVEAIEVKAKYEPPPEPPEYVPPPVPPLSSFIEPPIPQIQPPSPQELQAGTQEKSYLDTILQSPITQKVGGQLISAGVSKLLAPEKTAAPAPKPAGQATIVSVAPGAGAAGTGGGMTATTSPAIVSPVIVTTGSGGGGAGGGWFGYGSPFGTRETYTPGGPSRDMTVDLGPGEPAVQPAKSEFPWWILIAALGAYAVLRDQSGSS